MRWFVPTDMEPIESHCAGARAVASRSNLPGACVKPPQSSSGRLKTTENGRHQVTDNQERNHRRQDAKHLSQIHDWRISDLVFVQASGKNLKDTKGNDCHAKKCEYKEEMENRYPMRSSSLSPQDDANLPDDDCSGLAQASNPGEVPHRMAQRNEIRNETRMIPSGALTKPEKEGTKPGTKPE